MPSQAAAGLSCAINVKDSMLLTHDDIARLTPGELANQYFNERLDHLIDNLEVIDADENGVITGVIYDVR
ncbi:hypothetical protein [Nonomuraea sp. NPDC050783]|uniref:hypothetical protein n=1 Tax=Nonomuraea sp. NPDC050783 TaxID=3154634 RepID=UPI0034655ED7